MEENCFYSMYYEIVYDAKDNKPIFDENIMTDLHNIFTDVADEMKFDLLEVNGGPDYVRLLVSLTPEHRLFYVVEGLKEQAEKEIMSKHEYLRDEIGDTIWEEEDIVQPVCMEEDAKRKLAAFMKSSEEN